MPRLDRGFGDGLENGDPLLSHMTPDANLPRIIRDGLRAGSCWGTGDMADYYAGVIAEEGDRPVQLAIRLSDLHLVDVPTVSLRCRCRPPFSLASGSLIM